MKRFLRAVSKGNMSETALTMGLIAVVCIGALTLLGATAKDNLTDILIWNGQHSNVNHLPNLGQGGSQARTVAPDDFDMSDIGSISMTLDEDGNPVYRVTNSAGTQVTSVDGTELIAALGNQIGSLADSLPPGDPARGALLEFQQRANTLSASLDNLVDRREVLQGYRSPDPNNPLATPYPSNAVLTVYRATEHFLSLKASYDRLSATLSSSHPEMMAQVSQLGGIMSDTTGVYIRPTFNNTEASRANIAAVIDGINYYGPASAMMFQQVTSQAANQLGIHPFAVPPDRAAEYNRLVVQKLTDIADNQAFGANIGLTQAGNTVQIAQN